MLKRVFSTLSPLSSSLLKITKTTTPKPKLANDKLIFGKTFTDHMLEIDWDVNSGWSKPSIHPHRPLTIDPAASCLHYGLQAFEGMKAYIDKDGKIRLFRPDMNMARLQKSGDRLNFPKFDSKEFLECIKQLIKVDKSWIPHDDGFSLYIRPTYIATHPFLGVQPPSSVKMFAILSPVGPVFFIIIFHFISSIILKALILYVYMLIISMFVLGQVVLVILKLGLIMLVLLCHKDWLLRKVTVKFYGYLMIMLLKLAP